MIAVAFYILYPHYMKLDTKISYVDVYPLTHDMMENDTNHCDKGICHI